MRTSVNRLNHFCSVGSRLASEENHKGYGSPLGKQISLEFKITNKSSRVISNKEINSFQILINEKLLGSSDLFLVRFVVILNLKPVHIKAVNVASSSLSEFHSEKFEITLWILLVPFSSTSSLISQQNETRYLRRSFKVLIFHKTLLRGLDNLLRILIGHKLLLAKVCNSLLLRFLVRIVVCHEAATI